MVVHILIDKLREPLDCFSSFLFRSVRIQKPVLLWTKKMTRLLPLRIQTYQQLSLSKPGVGQNIAIADSTQCIATISYPIHHHARWIDTFHCQRAVCSLHNYFVWRERRLLHVHESFVQEGCSDSSNSTASVCWGNTATEKKGRLVIERFLGKG